MIKTSLQQIFIHQQKGVSAFYNKEVGIKRIHFLKRTKDQVLPQKKSLNPLANKPCVINKELDITKEPISCSSQKTRCYHKRSH